MSAPGSRADIESAVTGLLVAAVRQVLQSTPPDKEDLQLLAHAVDAYDAYFDTRAGLMTAAESNHHG